MDTIIHNTDDSMANIEESIANIISIVEKHSMQCRCGNLATPENLKGSTYNCPTCHKVYDGIGYDFTRLTSIASTLDSFNEALDILRTKTEKFDTSSNLLQKIWSKIIY